MTVVLEEAHYFFWGVNEKRPSGSLAKFLDWVKTNCDIDYDNKALRIKTTQQVGLKVPQAYEEAAARRFKVKKEIPEPPPPCPEGCKDFSKRGSNAQYIRLTCKKCGNWTREPRVVEPKFPTDTCRHQNTDFRNSDVRTHRIYCLDCATVITEMPQEVYR